VFVPLVCILIFVRYGVTGLVVEDAVSGVVSGKASGARTLASATTTPREVLAASGPDWMVPDLTQYVILIYANLSFDMVNIACRFDGWRVNWRSQLETSKSRFATFPCACLDPTIAFLLMVAL
jgi:hypothetical protein